MNRTNVKLRFLIKFMIFIKIINYIKNPTEILNEIIHFSILKKKKVSKFTFNEPNLFSNPTCFSKAFMNQYSDLKRIILNKMITSNYV